MSEKTTINTGNDSIVIVKCIESIVGGKPLDVTGFTPAVIQAGHVVIKNADGLHKPMPISGNAYAELPANHSIVGIVSASLMTQKKMAAIMVWGTVNEIATPYPVTDAIKAALPLIRFTKD